MGNSDNTHRIHVAIHNHQEEHQSTIVESTGKVNNVKLKILFDPGATDSFISPYALVNVGWKPASTTILNWSRWLQGLNKQ